MRKIRIKATERALVYARDGILLVWVTVLILFFSVSDTEKFNGDTKTPSITFLLGEDKAGHEFYSLAEEHFRYDPIAKTNEIIRHIRSLEELINYLNTHRPERPYGRIELVVHGNVWSGLSTKILEGGERAYPKELLKAVLQEKLPKLQSGIINNNTNVNVWGCGIGKNPLIKIALDSVFKDENGARAKVNPSKDFVIFKRVDPQKPPLRLNASYWPYFFKRGYRPSESVIVKAMKEQYPDVTIPWSKAIGSQEQEAFSEVYEENFNVSLSWLVVYENKTDRPRVSSHAEKMKWIQSQKGLMKKVKDLEIPIDKYQWTVNKIIHTNDNGEKVPAIKAIGMSTVLCVLLPERVKQLPKKCNSL